MEMSKTVMIVEDDALIATLMDRYFTVLGCKVLARLTFAEEVLDAFRLLKPDYVLMDIRLAGEMTGLDAGRQLIAEQFTNIIFASAFGTRDIQNEMEQIPHVRILQKPVALEDLRACIE